MFDVAVDALAPRGRLVIIGMMSQYADGWVRRQYPGALPLCMAWIATSCKRRQKLCVCRSMLPWPKNSPSFPLSALQPPTLTRHCGEAAVEERHAPGLLPAALCLRVAPPPQEAGGAAAERPPARAGEFLCTLQCWLGNDGKSP